MQPVEAEAFHGWDAVTSRSPRTFAFAESAPHFSTLPAQPMAMTQARTIFCVLRNTATRVSDIGSEISIASAYNARHNT